MKMQKGSNSDEQMDKHQKLQSEVTSVKSKDFNTLNNKSQSKISTCIYTIMTKLMKCLQKQHKQKYSLKFKLKLWNGYIYNAIINNQNVTTEKFKTSIYNIDQQLDINCMTLHFGDMNLKSDVKLSQLNLLPESVIVQSKITVDQVQNIDADAEGIDPLTCEKGVAKMVCGHFVGRDSMIALIRYLISSNRYEVKCPNQNQNEQPCNQLWDFSICRKVGVFSKSENAQFEEGLSKNWQNQNSRQCPKCKFTIQVDRSNNKIHCPKCKFNFCYMCNKKWGLYPNFCGNIQCAELNQLVAQSPWNKQFKLKDKDNNYHSYITPQFRACVHCYSVIQFHTACKHMLCSTCKKSFCWVCLAKYDQNKRSWPCESFYDYCGKIAPAQDLKYLIK